MPYFKDEREIYATLGEELFEDLLADPATARQFVKADGVVQWQFRNPRAEITTTAIAGEATAVALGPTDRKADVIVAMDADTAHGFWLGKVSIITALSAGQIKARGPVAKILSLVPLVKLAAPRYEALLTNLASAAAATPEPAGDGAPAEELPAEAPAEELPAEAPAEELPAEAPAEELPAEAPAEELPAEAPAEELPVEAPAEELPVEAPAEELPVEAPAEELPVEAPTDPARVGQRRAPARRLSSSSKRACGSSSASPNSSRTWARR